MSGSNNAPRVDMLRSPLSRARGLGSARAGSHHWWVQRLTAVALVPLTLWFIYSAILLTGATQDAMVAWLSAPHRMALMLALILATFHHLQLGLQVVIEDYIQAETCRLVALLAMKGACALLGLACIVAVLRLGL
jgi:succinate dehydrogenase / fumarate reductase membrane anchor subunit